MAEYRFERECRTAHSEAYLIVDGDEQVGKVDIHFTPSIVYATLCIGEKMTQDDIQDLIDTIDEDLVMSADVARDDFIVTVYQGREVGVFSDEEFEEEEEE
jgi:hypothetical protein